MRKTILGVVIGLAFAIVVGVGLFMEDNNTTATKVKGTDTARPAIVNILSEHQGKVKRIKMDTDSIKKHMSQVILNQKFPNRNPETGKLND